MAKDFSACFIKVRIKDVPNSDVNYIGTFDVNEKLHVALFEDDNPHTLGQFTLEELETNPTLEVEVIFKNFKLEDLKNRK